MKMYWLLTILVLAGTAYAKTKGTNEGLDFILQSVFSPKTTVRAPTPVRPDSNPATTIPTDAEPHIAESDVTTLQPTRTRENTSCTVDGRRGECVIYYLCDVKDTLSPSVDNDRYPCESYVDVCCLIPDQYVAVDPIPSRLEVQKPIIRDGCGWVNPDGVALSTDSETTDGKAKFAEFPWMVAVLKIEPVSRNETDGETLNLYIGGGSLIHPSAVLTAAHYLPKTAQLGVRAGEWDVQSTDEAYPHQNRNVETVVVHEEFTKGGLLNDIAILFLKSPFELAPNVGLACLPPYKESAKESTRCLATGWGKDEYGPYGRYQIILKKVEVPMVDHKTCQDQLRSTRVGRSFQLHDSFTCAGGEAGKGVCTGDDGSPLVCPIELNKERYVQNGIVSWFIGCGSAEVPGVYTDVSKMRNWIDDKIIAKQYDPKVYTY